MPTERQGNIMESFRVSFTNYLKDLATTVTLRKTTETKDGMNRITATSTATSTPYGDIQWITKQDLTLLDEGSAKIGDGMLFVEYDTEIDLHDNDAHYEVEFNSKRWRITSQIEGELVQGDVTYKAYIIKKNAQS